MNYCEFEDKMHRRCDQPASCKWHGMWLCEKHADYAEKNWSVMETGVNAWNEHSDD
jgi:hypothetical protein